MARRPGPLRSSLLPLALAASLVGCGGGGGGSEDDATLIVLVANPREESVNEGGASNATQILVADHVDNTSVVPFWTFRLPDAFASDTEIVSATLHTALTSSDGGLFATNGPVVLDHVDSTIPGSLAARNAPSLLDAFAALAADATVGPRDVDVTAAVRGDLAAGRTSCRLRARHQGGDTNGDGVGDFTRFGSQNDPPRSTLEILVHEGDGPTRIVLTTVPVERTVRDTGFASTKIEVGDFSDNVSFRPFWTFTLPVIPLGAEVASAVLRATVTSTDGRLLATNGPIVLDHVDSTIAGDLEARNAPSLLDAFASLVVDATLGQREVDVTDAVRGDVTAGRTACRLRARHLGGDTNGDGVGDLTVFGGVFNGPAATLEITLR